MKLNLNINFAELSTGDVTNRPGTKNSLSSKAMLNKKDIDVVVVEQCLDSLDVFRDLLEGIPLQKNRVVRDVCKAVQVERYGNEQIIYDIGNKATSIYLCLKGGVSMSIPEEKSKRTARSNGNSQKFATNIVFYQGDTEVKEEDLEINYIQIDSLSAGEGFGEAEFISQNKRTVRTTAVGETIIGRIQLQSFSEVFQNYKMRVYFKKRDMFLRCPLFTNINPQKLEFIINNTKPMSFKISDKLVSEGESVQHLYLINKGHISLWKNLAKEVKVPLGHKKYSSVLKIRDPMDVAKNVKKRISMGLKEEGNFIGDMEICLNKKSSINAVVSTEKAEVYYCDKRIILSQMSDEELEQASLYYKRKQQFCQLKMRRFKSLTSDMERQQKWEFLPPMSKDQQKIKRIINRRHTEAKPSLIGCCSPRDIEKMIDRKAKRLKTQPEENVVPVIEIFASKSEKKRSYSPAAFSPLVMVENPEFNRKKNDKLDRSITEISRNHSKSPDEEAESLLKEMKSVVIEMQPLKLSLKTVKLGRSENMRKAHKIVGSYKNSVSRRAPIDKLIKQIQIYSKL